MAEDSQDAPKVNTVSQGTPPVPQDPPPAETATATSQTTQSSQKPKGLSRKLVLVIVGILIVLGLVGGGVYYYLFWQNGKEKPREETSLKLPKATLNLNAPEDQQATTSAKILVSGKTNPNSTVSAYSENNEEIYEADATGNFSGTFVLEEGPNEITFVAFGSENEEQSETRSVVYVKEEEL